MELHPFSQQTDKPWGTEIIFTPPLQNQVGKIIFVKAGCKLSLQYHDQKEETILLFQGEGLIWLGENEETVKAYPIELQKGYVIKPGVIHRLQAVTDCYFFEVSSPETGTTYRLKDDYNRGNEQLT